MNTPSKINAKHLNVLTLDGGGVRGLSTLFILQNLMQQINSCIKEKTGEMEHKEVRPHQIFDLVAGTSTGGLIAIMLGKLGMTVDDCIKTYRDLSKEIFGKKHIRGKVTGGMAPSKYSGSRMRRCVCNLLEQKRFEADLPMKPANNEDKIACALITREHQSKSRYSKLKSQPVCICSLPCPQPLDCLVVDAARATSAAPTFFPAQKISGRCFVDGGMGYNNPSHEIFHHYTKINRIGKSRRASGTSDLTGTVTSISSHDDLDFSQTRFVNLGTGTNPDNPEPRQSSFAFLMPKPIRMTFSLKDNLKNIAIDSERIAESMRLLAHVSTNGSYSIKYDRFSADNGVCKIGLDAFKEIPEIERLTFLYLDTPGVQQSMERVAAEIATDYLQEYPQNYLAVPEGGTMRPQTPVSQTLSASQQSTDTRPSTRLSRDHFGSSAQSTPTRVLNTEATTPSSGKASGVLGLGEINR